MNEDWEQVTPFLQEMQHCTDDDYFNPQEVSALTCEIVMHILKQVHKMNTQR